MTPDLSKKSNEGVLNVLHMLITEIKEMETNLWKNLTEVSKIVIPHSLAIMQRFATKAREEVNLIENIEGEIIQAGKTQLAKEIENDLKKLHDIIVSQIEKLKDIMEKNEDEIMSILKGHNKESVWLSKSAQLCNTILEKLEREENTLIKESQQT